MQYDNRYTPFLQRAGLDVISFQVHRGLPKFNSAAITMLVDRYYARDMLNKLQRLRQGTNSVEEYFQELQIGMLRCGLVENDDAVMARFLGGLNQEIQDVLDYKEYNNITHLFHLACKAEREVQGRHTRT